MKKVQPTFYIVAQTALNHSGVSEFLHDIGTPDWKPNVCSHVSDGENLIEFMGRLCYRAWQPYDEAKPDATNPNVRKVRQGNDVYIKNILSSRHGSVIEHVNVSVVFHNASRAMTHELVRHRLASYSQESLRYVRLTNIKMWVPPGVEGNSEALNLWLKTVEYLEEVQQKLADIFGINSITDFATKKILTSMFRRLAPIGLATTIGMTANLRSWRFILGLRSNKKSAEEEIAMIMEPLGKSFKAMYPNVFQDMKWDGNAWVFENDKV